MSSAQQESSTQLMDFQICSVCIYYNMNGLVSMRTLMCIDPCDRSSRIQGLCKPLLSHLSNWGTKKIVLHMDSLIVIVVCFNVGLW